MSEPPSSTAPEPPGAVGRPPEDEPPAHRSRRSRRAGAGVAVGAVLLVAILLFTGVIPWLPTATPSSGIPYSQAASLADAAVPSGFAAHPILLGAVGVDSRPGTTLPISGVANTTSNCTVTPLPGYPISGMLSVPSFSGAFDSGLAPFWVVAFEAGSTGPYAVIGVVQGSAEALATLSGTNCGSLISGVNPLPAPVADSPAAASAAWGAGGSAYVGRTAGATTLTMTAFGGSPSGVFTSPLWLFLYGPCAPLFSGNTTAQPAYLSALTLATASPLLGFTTSVRCPA